MNTLSQIYRHTCQQTHTRTHVCVHMNTNTHVPPVSRPQPPGN
uniref:Uncharacterized protein n=1 Tax=Anguilla anguilla TaxID=7936 RepID=A0A0E9QBV6_ANGAN